MIQSMTGFGSASRNSFTVEVRSLNHRYIDIFLKSPAYISQHEITLRNILKEHFQRGRFDVTVSVPHEKGTPLAMNTERAKSLYAAMLDLQKEIGIPGQISMETLAGIRELYIELEPEYNTDDLLAAFHEAVSNLEQMRIREGSLLTEELTKRLGVLEELTNRIKSLAPDEIVRWREKFIERLKLILDAEMIDTNRILQEAAVMAEKLDIEEEINRLENHRKQFSEILQNESIVGRKLDFLLQEMGREVNTLAYKSGDYAISNIVVEMKTEIEKIREQTQNLQ
ncbi:MAG: YicC/YloC family endoribonuclease [Thermodesulfovibrionales bacterium]|nr:YicC/YloC family endoribonuclease [Thermodesulfovibrionales bacterium]